MIQAELPQQPPGKFFYIDSVHNSVYSALHNKGPTMSVRTLSVTEAKQRFTELVKQVGKYYDRYLVTKNGSEAAVVMSSEEYGSLLETIDILGSRSEVKAIAEGQEQVRKGKTIPLAAYRAARVIKRTKVLTAKVAKDAKLAKVQSGKRTT